MKLNGVVFLKNSFTDEADLCQTGPKKLCAARLAWKAARSGEQGDGVVDGWRPTRAPGDMRLEFGFAYGLFWSLSRYRLGWLVGVVWRFWLAACFFLRLLLLLLCVRHPHPFRHLLARCPAGHPPPATCRSHLAPAALPRGKARAHQGMDGWMDGSCSMIRSLSKEDGGHTPSACSSCSIARGFLLFSSLICKCKQGLSVVPDSFAVVSCILQLN
jgi:hypothetical protein